VTQIERQVRRIERDLTRVRFTLKKLKPRSRTLKLATLQKSIAEHLTSDEDPATILLKMRRR